MIVFFLYEECGYEGVFPIGIFSSEEKVEEARQAHLQRYLACCSYVPKTGIDQYEIDEPFALDS